MAAAKVIYVIEDSKRAKSNCVVYIPESTLADDAEEFAIAMGDLILTLISGRITNISVTYDVNISGLTGNTVTEGSDVEEGARFQFVTIGGYRTACRLPTFLESFITAGTALVDTTDTDVDNFVQAMVSGLTMTSTNVVAPTDYRANGISSLEAALESFQKSRRVR